VDWDGNELLLSDIGTENDLIHRSIEDEIDKELLAMAMKKLSVREKKIMELRLKNAEGSCRYAWYFPVVHFQTGKEDYQ